MWDYKKNGFTLIELLIVIAIIGILAVALMSAIGTGSINRARDSQIISEMTELQKGLETYQSVTGDYPSAADLSGELTTDYVQQRLIDNLGNYEYTPGTNSYCLCNKNSLNIKDSGNSDNNTCTTDSGGSKDFYCLRNLQ